MGIRAQHPLPLKKDHFTDAESVRKKLITTNALLIKITKILYLMRPFIWLKIGDVNGWKEAKMAKEGVNEKHLRMGHKISFFA